MEREALKKTIIAYMEIHNTLSLATEKDGAPHAATVFYVNTGFEIYFLSSPSTRHGEHLAHNPRVSATIDEDYSNWILVNCPAHRAGHLKKLDEGDCIPPLPPLRIRPRPQDGVFCGRIS